MYTRLTATTLTLGETTYARRQREGVFYLTALDAPEDAQGEPEGEAIAAYMAANAPAPDAGEGE